MTVKPPSTPRRPRSRKGAPGIVDVAGRAGVSPATVSRHFNHPALLRPDTRLRIERAASELGYIRDRMAGTLHNRSSGTIGLVVPTIHNAIFSELIEAFSAELQEHDRTMLIASHTYDLATEVTIIRSLLERRIDGVAIVGHDHLDVAMEMLKVRDIPVIALWSHDASGVLPSIGIDNGAAGRLITRHVIDLGHRDIAFVFPDTRHNDRARDRRLGALGLMRESGLPVPDDRTLLCPYDIGAAKQLGLELLQGARPSAIVCCNDIIAQGMVYAAQRLGLRIPDNVSIAGIGDFAGSADMEPGLTTVRLPARRIGRAAADAIVRMSQARSSVPPDPVNVLMDVELKVRASTGRAREALEGRGGQARAPA